MMFCTINVVPRFSSASFFDLREVSRSKFTWCFIFTLSEQIVFSFIWTIPISSTIYYVCCIVIYLCVHIQLALYLCIPTTHKFPSVRCCLLHCSYFSMFVAQLNCLTIWDLRSMGVYCVYKARRVASQPIVVWDLLLYHIEFIWFWALFGDVYKYFYTASTNHV